MSEAYLTVARAVTASIEVKRSVFRCDLTPVDDEEAARAAVEAARKEFWDARHHCSAFVIGPDRALRRSNDDGEPSGTAGVPMLDVLAGAELTDVVAVVTRWFGGTLLGTGGLVKAYGDATRAALEQARIVRYERREVLRVDVGVADVGKVENALRTQGFAVLGTEYGTGREATLTVAVPAERLDEIDGALASLTSGRRAFTPSGTTWTAV